MTGPDGTLVSKNVFERNNIIITIIESPNFGDGTGVTRGI